jgi:hypothetical protein
MSAADKKVFERSLELNKASFYEIKCLLVCLTEKEIKDNYSGLRDTYNKLNKFLKNK